MQYCKAKLQLQNEINILWSDKLFYYYFIPLTYKLEIAMDKKLLLERVREIDKIEGVGG